LRAAIGYLQKRVNEPSAIRAASRHAFPAMIKIDAPGRLTIKGETVSGLLGREWDPQEIHMSVVSLSGSVDEDDRSDPVRFSYIERDKVIETPVFLAGTRRLAEIYAHHEILRPPNVAIYGLSGIGKSHLIEEFERQHPARRDRKTGQLIVPVARVQLPFAADERWLLSEISLKLGYPDTLPRMRSEAFRKVIERLCSRATNRNDRRPRARIRRRVSIKETQVSNHRSTSRPPERQSAEQPAGRGHRLSWMGRGGRAGDQG